MRSVEHRVSNVGEGDRSVEVAKKAFDLRERVSERERYYITDHFYTATGDIEKQKETLELATKAYPNDSAAFGNLAIVYGQRSRVKIAKCLIAGFLIARF